MGYTVDHTFKCYTWDGKSLLLLSGQNPYTFILITSHISNPFHLTPILYSDIQHYMRNTVCVVVLLDKSLNLFIYLFFALSGLESRNCICTFVGWKFCVSLSRFGVKSAKAVSYRLTCHSWRKFVTMWESSGQSLPLNRRRKDRSEEGGKGAHVHTSSTLLILSLLFTNFVISLPLWLSEVMSNSLG